MKKILSAMLVLSALLHSEAIAKPLDSDELIETLSDEQALSLLHEAGYADAKIDEEDDDRTTFVFLVEDREVFLRSYRETNDLRIYAIFEINHEIDRETVELANRWNREQRWVKAYIDEENRWVIEADLIVESGIRAEGVTTFIRRFVDVLPDFEKFSENWRGGGPDFDK